LYLGLNKKKLNCTNQAPGAGKRDLTCYKASATHARLERAPESAQELCPHVFVSYILIKVESFRKRGPYFQGSTFFSTL